MDFGLAEETGSSSRPVGTNIRDRLRRVAESKQDHSVSPTAEPAPPIPTPEGGPDRPAIPHRPPAVRVSPTTASPPPPAPISAAPSIAGPPAPPSILVNSTSVPIAITLMYPSQASFLADYRETLKSSAITVRHAALTDLYRPVDVKIQFHDGTFIEVMGQTVAVTPSGMAVALAFSSVHHAQMTLLARG